MDISFTWGQVCFAADCYSYEFLVLIAVVSFAFAAVLSEAYKNDRYAVMVFPVRSFVLTAVCLSMMQLFTCFDVQFYAKLFVVFSCISAGVTVSIILLRYVAEDENKNKTL